jgi:hypothetical protein
MSHLLYPDAPSGMSRREQQIEKCLKRRPLFFQVSVMSCWLPGRRAIRDQNILPACLEGKDVDAVLKSVLRAVLQDERRTLHSQSNDNGL